MRTSTPSCRSSRASPSTWPCTPPGAGHASTDSIDRDLHSRQRRLPVRRGRWASSVASGAIVRGATRIRPRTRSAIRWVDAAMSSRNRPSRSTGIGGRTTARWSRPGPKVDGGGDQCRARAQRECGRPGRQRGALTEELDLHAVARQVTVGQQAHDPVGAQRTAARRRDSRHRAARSRGRSFWRCAANHSNSSGGSTARRPRACRGRASPSRPRRTPSRRGAGSARITPLPASSRARCGRSPDVEVSEDTVSRRTSPGSRSISSQ